MSARFGVSRRVASTRRGPVRAGVSVNSHGQRPREWVSFPLTGALRGFVSHSSGSSGDLALVAVVALGLVIAVVFAVELLVLVFRGIGFVAVRLPGWARAMRGDGNGRRQP